MKNIEIENNKKNINLSLRYVENILHILIFFYFDDFFFAFVVSIRDLLNEIFLFVSIYLIFDFLKNLLRVFDWLDRDIDTRRFELGMKNKRVLGVEFAGK